MNLYRSPALQALRRAFRPGTLLTGRNHGPIPFPLHLPEGTLDPGAVSTPLPTLSDDISTNGSRRPILPKPVPSNLNPGTTVGSLPSLNPGRRSEQSHELLPELRARMKTAKEELEASFVDGRPTPRTMGPQTRLMDLQMQERQLLGDLKGDPREVIGAPDTLENELARRDDAFSITGNGFETKAADTQPRDRNKIGELLEKGKAAKERLDHVINEQQKQLRFLEARQKTEPDDVDLPGSLTKFPTLKAVEIFLKAVSGIYKFDRRFVLPKNIEAFKHRIQKLEQMRATVEIEIEKLEVLLNEQWGS